MSRIASSGSLATSLVNARDRFAVVSSGGAPVRQVAPVSAPARVSQYRTGAGSYRPDIIDASFVDIEPSGDATFIGRFSVAEAYARIAAPAPAKGRVADFFV